MSVKYHNNNDTTGAIAVSPARVQAEHACFRHPLSPSSHPAAYNRSACKRLSHVMRAGLSPPIALAIAGALPSPSPDAWALPDATIPGPQQIIGVIVSAPGTWFIYELGEKEAAAARAGTCRLHDDWEDPRLAELAAR
jgi:hypothetical protein